MSGFFRNVTNVIEISRYFTAVVNFIISLTLSIQNFFKLVNISSDPAAFFLFIIASTNLISEFNTINLVMFFVLFLFFYKCWVSLLCYQGREFPSIRSICNIFSFYIMIVSFLDAMPLEGEHRFSPAIVIFMFAIFVYSGISACLHFSFGHSYFAYFNLFLMLSIVALSLTRELHLSFTSILIPFLFRRYYCFYTLIVPLAFYSSIFYLYYNCIWPTAISH